ncbi:MAG: R3H domain-containing nucleic acid-binding protein [Candidatus Spechtbacterales bacterium]
MSEVIKIKNDIKELLEGMNLILLYPPEVHNNDERTTVSVFVDDPRALIGEGGASLRAFQHIIRLMAVKKYGPDIKVDVDVNGYKQKRAEFLREMALSARRRAIEKGGSVELEPMNAFDRRVIHTTLSEFKDVETESTGEYPQRRVTIGLV